MGGPIIWVSMPVAGAGTDWENVIAGRAVFEQRADK